MNRFALLAVISFGLTTLLVYESGVSAVHGLATVIGIGVPRLVTPGLLQLGLAILLLNLSWLTFRGARQMLTIARLIRTRDRDRRRHEHASR